MYMLYHIHTYVCTYIRTCNNTILYKDINSKTCLKDLLSIETTEGWFIIHCSCTKASHTRTTCLQRPQLFGPLSGCCRQVLLYTHCLYCTCRWNTVKTQCIVPHMHIKHPNGYVNEMYIHTYIRMYVRMYPCTYVCMYVTMYPCTHVPIYVCTHVCMYVRMYPCTHVPIYVCTHVRMYPCTYVPMYVCTHVRTYVCIYSGACKIRHPLGNEKHCWISRLLD